MPRLAPALVFLFLALLPALPASAAEEVVVYCSVDQVFSEPVLKKFEEQTGIRVHPLFDVEATKTVGLVNRLIAEKDRPRADVFWNSEISRTLVLAGKGVLAPYQSPAAADIPAQFKDRQQRWTAFSARARVLLYNTDLVKDEEAPRSIFDLADAKWRGRAAMAYPLFGTTAMHMAALHASMGEEKLTTFLQQLLANDLQVVDGNAVARDRVVEGKAAVCITDTDDANVALERGAPVKLLFPDQEGIGTLLIPNTVALVAGAPHPEAGRRLIDYLLSAATEKDLALSEAAQLPVRPALATPPRFPRLEHIKAMDVGYEAIESKLQDTTALCQKLFTR